MGYTNKEEEKKSEPKPLPIETKKTSVDVKQERLKNLKKYQDQEIEMQQVRQPQKEIGTDQINKQYYEEQSEQDDSDRFQDKPVREEAKTQN